MTPQETISRTIEAELAARHLTKTSLANHLGINRRTLQTRFDGTASWNLPDLEATANHLGLTL